MKQTVAHRTKAFTAWELPEAESERAPIPYPPSDPVLFACQRLIAPAVSQRVAPYLLQEWAYRSRQLWQTWRQRLPSEDVPQPLGLGLYPHLPCAYEGPRSDVILFEAAQHPLAAQGQFFIPQAERERLQRMHTAGIDIPILILEELPAGTVRRYGLATVASQPHFFLPPPARATLELNERLGQRAIALGHLLGTSAVAGTALLVAAGAGLALAPLFLLGLDPLILGVWGARPQPMPGDLVAVFALSAWRW